MSDSRGDWDGQDLDASRDVAALLLMLVSSQRRGDCELLLAAAEAEARTGALLRQALCELVHIKRCIVQGTGQDLTAWLQADITALAGEKP